MVVVLQLFKRHGKSRLIHSSDWPVYVETIRPIYEAEELEAMFKAAREDEATLLKFLVASGLRDQEIRYLTWRDIDFRHSVVRVTAKPIWGYSPKNWEERAVPVTVKTTALPAPAAMLTVAARLLPEPLAPLLTEAAPVVEEVQLTPVRVAGMASATLAPTTLLGPLLVTVMV